MRGVFGTEPTRRCVSIFAQDTGRLTEIYERAVPVSTSTAAAALDAAVELAGVRPGWWFVSGGLPDSAPVSLLADAVRRLHDAGVRVAVDSHGAALRGAVDAGPDLVKVNRAEALELVGGVRDVRARAARRDARAHRGTGRHHRRRRRRLGDRRRPGAARAARRHAGGFSVGSGDSFLGGLLVALDGGADLAEALALATATGTANAQVPGAAVLDPALARRLAQEVEISVGR